MNKNEKKMTSGTDRGKRRQFYKPALVAILIVVVAGVTILSGCTGALKDSSLQTTENVLSIDDGLSGAEAASEAANGILSDEESLSVVDASPEASDYDEKSLEEFKDIIQIIDAQGNNLSLDELPKEDYNGFVFKLDSDAAKSDDVKEKIAAGLKDGAIRQVNDDIYEADSLDTIAAMFNETHLEYIEPDYYMHLIGEVDVNGGTGSNPAPDYPPSDPEYTAGALWNLDMLKVQGAWEAGLDGDPYIYNGKAVRDSKVRVAVIDTGLYGTGTSEDKHEDLNYENMFSGTNFVTDQEGTPDAHGHGTFVAGLIAAQNNEVGVVGAQPGVEVVSEKVFDTGSASTANVISAIYAAVDEDGADVINMSLGGEYNERSLEVACDYAVSKGVLVVASAGNDGVSTPNYPAAYDSVVGVASVNSAQQRSTWSQYGRSVFVTAPGENVRSTYTGASDAYKTASGTSFSGPEVAALAAMCKSVYPDIDQDTFKQFLIETSTDLGAKGYDDYYGWGLVDFTKMAEAVLESQVMPWYNIEFKLTDEDGRNIDVSNATITLTADEDISWEADPENGIEEAGSWKKGTTIDPESAGKFKLHRGNYAYTVVVDGKYTESGTFKTYTENQTITVTLSKAYAVTVNAVDSQGQAVNDAIINVNSQSGRKETPKSEENNKTVYDLASGIYSYEAEATGYEKSGGSFTVQRADMTINAVLYKADELSTVKFDVTDNSDNSEVVGANITVTDESGVVIAAKEDGTWRLAKGSTYTVTVTKPGFENASKEFKVEDSDEEQTVEVSLQRASNRVTFKVIDTNNKVIANPSAKVADSEGNPVESVTDNNLQFTLSEGDYTYEVTAPGYTVKTGSFGVALDSYTITVVLEAVPARITFAVVDDQTEDVINDATIKINLSDRLRAIEPTSLGVYLLEPGKYDYTVYKEGYKTALGTFTVEGNEKTITVRLTTQSEGSGYAGGSGTEDDPYLIATEDQLRYLAEQTEIVRVTSSTASTNQKRKITGHFRLINDIEITGGEWLPIGNSENGLTNYVAFAGEFDGGGYTVSGIQISNNYDYQGFFGYVHGAYIHDLIVDGEISINGKSASSGGSYVGGIVGGIYAANDPLYTTNNTPPTTIARCGNLADVTARYAVGGIVGSAQGAMPSTGLPDGAPDEAQINIIDCYNKGTIRGMYNGSYLRQTGTGTTAAGRRAGGIAGSAQYTAIKNCYNAGDIQAGANVGGITAYSNIGRITSCYNSGHLYQHSNSAGDGGTTGAMAGGAVRTEIEYSYGMKRSDNYADVILGYAGYNAISTGSSMLSHDDMYRTDDFIKTLNENATSDSAGSVYRLGHDYPMLYWEWSGTEDAIPAKTPVIIEHPEGIEEVDAYMQGEEAKALTSRIEDITAEEGSVTWQWFVSDTDKIKDAKPAPRGIGHGMEATYVPSTEDVGVKYYFCVFTNRLGLDLDMSEASVTSSSAAIYVRETTPAEAPVITKLNPGTSTDFNTIITAKQGTDVELSVTAKVSDGGELTYQWYYSESGSGTGKTIEGATGRTYQADASRLGTGYYYVEVTNTTGPGNIAKTISDWIKVTVEPYSISTYQELAAFRTAVNSGNTFYGQIVYLLDDIEIPDGVDWTPIGTSDYPFMGTFMGGTGYAGSDPDTIKVHKITNLFINGDNHNNEKIGLFGVASGATICDVQVGGRITGEGNINTGLLVGQIIANGSKASSIENCGTLKGSSVEGAYSVGGLAGYVQATMANCANHADVFGRVYKGNLGSGTITADSKYAVGGVSGFQSSGNMLGCYNMGTITIDEPSQADGTVCATRVGGVAGATGYYAGVASSYNAGKLEIAKVAESQYERGALYIGSVVGYLNSANGVNNYYLEETWERGTDGSDHIERAEMRSTQFMKTDYFTELLNTGTGNYAYNQFRTSENGVPHLVWEEDNDSGDEISSAEPYITNITSADFPDITNTFKGTYFRNTTIIDPIIVWADTPDGGNLRYEWSMRKQGEDDDAWVVVAEGAMTTDADGKNGQAPVTVDVSQIGVFEYKCEVFNKRPDANTEPLEESMYIPPITITVKDESGVISLRDPSAENSKDNPWVIDTAAKMKFFADIVNGNEIYRPITDSTFEGQYVELEADIDISEYAPWQPVGSNTSTYDPTAGVFKGTFDGANHKIEGLTIINPDRNDYNALFGQSRMATIRNLEVAGTVEMDSASAYCTAGVVAYGYGCFIENVVNRVNVTGAHNTGGIVGNAGSCKILDCENIGNISMNNEFMNSKYGGYDVGGIAGAMFNSAGADGAGIFNCFNNGTVTGNLYDGDYRIGAILGGTGTGITTESFAHNYYRSGSIVIKNGEGTAIGGGSYEPVADDKGICWPIDDTDSPETAYALDTSDGNSEHSMRWGNYIREDIGDTEPCVHLVRDLPEKVIYHINNNSASADLKVSSQYANAKDEIEVSWTSKDGFEVGKVGWRIVGSDEVNELGEGSEGGPLTFTMPEGDVEFVVEAEQDTTHRYAIDSELIYNEKTAPEDAGEISVISEKENKAAADETVKINLTVADGYQIKSVTVTDIYGGNVKTEKIDSLNYSFTMPSADVKIEVVLEDYGTPADKQAASQAIDSSAIHYRNPDSKYTTADLLYEVMVLSGTAYGIDDPWMTYELERWTNPGLYQQDYSIAGDGIHTYTGLDVAKWLRNRIGEEIPADTPVSFEGADGTIYATTYGELTKLTYSCYDTTGQPEVKGLPVLLYFGVDGVPNTNGAMGIAFGQESPDDDNTVKNITGLKRICVGEDISSMQHVYDPYNDFDAISGGKTNDKQGYTDLTIRIYRGGTDSKNKGTLVNEEVFGLDEIEQMANEDRANIHRGYYSAYHYEDKDTATASSKYTDYYEGYDLYKLLQAAGVPYEPDATVQFYQTGMNGLDKSWETVNVSLGYLAGNGENGEGDYSGNIMSYNNADDSGAGPASGTMTNVVPLLLYGKNGLPLVWSSGTTGRGYYNYNYRGPMIAFLPQNAAEGGDHVGNKSAFSCYLALIEVYLDEETDEVDKSELVDAMQKAVDAGDGIYVSEDGSDIDPSDMWVDQSVKDALDDAIAAAQAVYDDPDATQEEVDDATDALTKATEEFIESLKNGNKKADVDKEALKQAVDDALDDYNDTKVSNDGTDINKDDMWAAQDAFDDLMDAIEKAQKVIADEDATQDEVDAAVEALNAAKQAFDDAKKAGTKQADKSALEAAIENARTDLDETDISEDGSDVYPSDEWTNQEAADALQAAIDKAKEVLADENAKQADVDAATSELEDAIKAFDEAKQAGTKATDKGELEKLINKATDDVENTTVSEDGTDVDPDDEWVDVATQDALNEAIKAAQEVYDNPDATDEEVAEAVAAIKEAKDAFDDAKQAGKKVADKSVLEEAVASAQKASDDANVSEDGSDIDPSDMWVDQSVKDALDDAIAAAQAVYDDPDATQQEVDDATDALNKAIQKFENSKKAGNKKDTPQTVAVTGVVLDKTSATATAGDTVQLKATVSPTSATNKAVTWKSSDTSVATVDANGKVTAKKAGTATITATTKDGNKTAICKVTVKAKEQPTTKPEQPTTKPQTVAVTGIKITPASAELATKKTLQMKVEITPSNATNKGIKWESSDKSVATVDQNGKVTAIKYGKPVTITATTKEGKKVATAKIQTRFYDVNNKSKQYYWTPVYWAADKNITKGYTDNKAVASDSVYFGPQRDCTRKEMIIFLWRLSGKPKASGSLPFSDTKNMNKSSDGYKAVLWGYKNGIIKGYEKGKFKGQFRLNDSVARKDTLIMLYRLAKKPKVSGKIKFPDVVKQNYKPTSDTYKAILWGTQKKITKGYSDGNFRPFDNCLREHIVTFIYRYAKNVK